MKLTIGKEQTPEPEVRFWLEERVDGVWLVAKHCSDISSQNIAAIKLNAAGEICIELRRLFAYRLCQALGVSQSGIIHSDVEPLRPSAAGEQS